MTVPALLTDALAGAGAGSLTTRLAAAPVDGAIQVPVDRDDYLAVLPMLVVFGGAVLGVLVEAFVPRRARYGTQVGLTLAALVAALVAVVRLHGEGRSALLWSEAVAVDGPTLFLQGSLLLLSLVAVLLIAERSTEGDRTGAFAAQAATVPGSRAERAATAAGLTQTEVYPLALFAVGGMLLFPAANDLLIMFVALEVLSLPLYLLCGLARRHRLLSQEAALKYFLLGAFSSAFFLYGAALVYGYAGTVKLPGIAGSLAAATGDDTLLVIGFALLAMGLLFKVGAVPFHLWTPDVYQGAPTAVTAFMAAATKVAAFGALLRVLYVAFGGLRWSWEPVLWGVAILTMVVGAVIAVVQTDVKRMLAYSSIAHAGFLLTGTVALSRQGLEATLFYLFVYGFVTLGAFAVVTLVRGSGGGEATHLASWAGLGRRQPLLAGVFALFLLAFAGIPMTSGFIGKFAVFAAAVEAGAWALALVGVVSSAIAAFFYVRVIVLMFFREPTGEAATVVAPGAATTTAIALAAAVTVVLGIFPGQVIDLAHQAATFQM